MRSSKKFYFSFGEPYCVREVLQRMYPFARLQSPESLSYSTDIGEDDLIDLLGEYILRTTSTAYEYVIVTPGCIPAVNCSMRVLAKHRKLTNVAVHKDSFFYYSNMVTKNGFNVVDSGNYGAVGISDSPNNPYGTYCALAPQYNNIWDSVYYSDVFINGYHMPPGHVINCGSVSKTLGLTGLRIGYIATNDKKLAELLTAEVKYEYCTTSRLTQQYLCDILNVVDFDRFTLAARGSINNNREEIAKLEYLLQSPMSVDGMFYCGFMDDSAKKLFNSAQVEWTDLPSGRSRLSLGQNNELTKEMVRTILKIDGK